MIPAVSANEVDRWRFATARWRRCTWRLRLRLSHQDPGLLAQGTPVITRGQRAARDVEEAGLGVACGLMPTRSPRRWWPSPAPCPGWGEALARDVGARIARCASSRVAAAVVLPPSERCAEAGGGYAPVLGRVRYHTRSHDGEFMLVHLCDYLCLQPQHKYLESRVTHANMKDDRLSEDTRRRLTLALATAAAAVVPSAQAAGITIAIDPDTGAPTPSRG